VTVDSASDTNFLLLVSKFVVLVLKLPDFIDVSHPSIDLILVLCEGVASVELIHVGDIIALSKILPCIIDILSLLHQVLDTVNSWLVEWLVVKRSLADCLEIQDILFLLIFSFVDENFVVELLNFNVPRVVGLGGAHQDCGDLVSREDVRHVLFDQLNHHGVVVDGWLNGLVFDDAGLKCSGLLRGGHVPGVIISHDFTSLDFIPEEDRLECG